MERNVRKEVFWLPPFVSKNSLILHVIFKNVPIDALSNLFAKYFPVISPHVFGTCKTFAILPYKPYGQRKNRA